MNATYSWLGVAIAIFLYGVIIKAILAGEPGHSFATWSLWVTLDIIASVSVILQGGNFIILLIYVIGGSAITLTLIARRQFNWGAFEWFVLSLVIVCLVVWSFSGPRWATIASTLAVVIAGAPQCKDSWKSPDRKTALIFTGWVVVNILFTLAGKAWTVEERFYPMACVILTAAIVIAAARPRPIPSLR